MTKPDRDEARSETTLDPDDWSAFRKSAHDLLDAALDRLEGASDGAVWTPVPDHLRATPDAPLPTQPETSDSMAEALGELMAHGVGNTHPRFFGWVHGAGSAAGLMSAIAAAAMNANCGGRAHAAIEVERQLCHWMRSLFGFPETAQGLVTSGTSLATLVALKTARDAALGFESRETGVEGGSLVGYTSCEAHACIARAFDMLGLGEAALRKVAVDDAFCMRPDALEASIERDIGDGRTPFAVIATAGTVNTGAIEDLVALGEVARRYGLWFHVDGAFAASGMMSEALRPALKGIEQADSLAFDFHKWAQVNYEAGYVLVRDGALQMQAFSSRPDYLKRQTRGLAAGNPWPVDLGPELSRSFRALKVWTQLKAYGTERLGAVIAQNMAQARYLSESVSARSGFELMAPTETSICCFRYAPPGIADAELDALNEEIVLRLQEEGLAVPSTTKIRGQLAIRVNITNHRTRFSDLDLLLEGIERIGRQLEREDFARGVPG